MIDQPQPDLPRDEHLRAALRHAPDAGVGAPADLGVKIRAAAVRAATASTAPSPPSQVLPSWPERLWSWLGQSGRWGALGAFATMLFATVIALVWRSEVPPTKRHDEQVAVRSQRSLETTPALQAPAPSLGAADARNANATRATPPAAEQSAAAPDHGAGQSAAAPAEAKAARRRAASGAGDAAAVAADQAAGPRASTDAARSLSRDGGLASSRAIGGASHPDFATWLDEAAKRNDAPELLLAELAAFTRGRWLHLPEPPRDGHAVDLPVNGQRAATLTLTDDAVWGCLMTPELRCQRAPLTPEQASRLRELFAQRR